MNLVSVVIPCYNQGQYLEESVESVLAQTYKHIEIVIVNDGSTELHTINLLKGFDKPKCRILHTENRGLPAARNTGIRAASGEYICCLDADDKYHPDYFKKAVKVFDADDMENYGAVPAWVQFFGTSNILWKTLGHNTEGFEPFLQGLRNNIQSATMFRRNCWKKIGGFDESMTFGYEDWDFWIKMLHRGYQWYCIDEVLIFYRQKEESMVTRADEVRERLLADLIQKNQSFYAEHFAPMLLARDDEVRRLQEENRRLADQLATAAGPANASFPTRVVNGLRRIFSS